MKQYKCNHCHEVRTILTLGDMYEGCANCGSLDGFMEREIPKLKWQPVQKNADTEKLNAILN